MKTKTILLTLAAAWLTLQSHAQEAATSAPPVSPLEQLPTGEITVDIVAPLAPPNIQKAFAKLEDAITKKGEWWSGYRTQHVKTEVLMPYHKNLGITEKEYKELIHYIKNNAKFGVAAQEEITIASTRDGKLQLIATGALGPWSGLILDPKDNEATLGRKPLQFIRPDAAMFALGPFAGSHAMSWAHLDENMNYGTGSYVHISLYAPPGSPDHLYLDLTKLTVVGGRTAESKRRTARIPRHTTTSLPGTAVGIPIEVER